MSIEVRPATPDVWPDVAAVFAGPRGHDACWCQRFRQHDSSENQAALEAEVVASPVPIGLVAYLDDRPAGWTRVVPRHTLPGVVGNSALRRVLADDDVPDDAAWWVSCFAVRRGERGHGVGLALLRAAVEFAHEQRAVVLDGHPVDVARLSARPSPSAVFTGTKAMFDAVGFVELGRTYLSRPVMRKRLT